MKEEIESITEAFSMQPNGIYVCPNAHPHIHSNTCCEKIKAESIMVGRECGDPENKIYA